MGELLVGDQQRRYRPQSIDVQVATERLLRPLLKVLFAAGLAKDDLLRVCESLAAEMINKRSGPKLRQLNHERGLERLISLWMTSPEFSGGSRNVLPLHGRVGSFCALARAAAPGRKPSTLLKELKDLRLVRILPNSRVRLVDHFLPMRAGNAFDLALFTQLATDFLRTHEINLLSGAKRGEGLFQRVAHRDGIDVRTAIPFDRFARKHGKALLASVDDWLARHGRVHKRRRTARLGLGVYVINDAVGRKKRP